MYEVPVTSTGLVNVQVFETVRVSPVLSLCIGDVKVNVEKTFPSGSPDMTGTNSNPLGGFNNLKSDATLEPSDNNNIALAPTNNIFLINQQNNNNNNQPVVFNPEIKISGSRSVDPYLAMAEYGKTTALMTT